MPSSEKPDSGAKGKAEKRKEMSPEEAVELTERAAEFAKEKGLKDFVAGAVDFIDDTKAMGAVQELWDKMPEAAQMAMVHAPAVGEPFKAMIRTGLLEYKRTPTEKEVASFAADEKMKLELVEKYGKYLDPQLAALDPFLGPLKKVEDAKEGVYAHSRKRLEKSRKERRDADDAERIRNDLAA